MDFNKSAVKTVKEDPSRILVWTVFDAIKTLLSKCSVFIKKNLNDFVKSLEAYATLIFETFENKILCQIITQDREVEEDLNDLEENQAEYDYMLKEYAGDCIPSLALCLAESMFDAYFDKMLDFLLRLLNKPDSSIAEQSFVIGVVGETISNLTSIGSNRAQKLFTGKLAVQSSVQVENNPN